MVILFLQTLTTLYNKSILPPCIFHKLTGYPCPTCGSTRALISLFHFDIFSAVKFNPLVTIGSFLLVAYITIGLLLMTVTGRFPEPKWTPQKIKLLQFTVVSAITANWIYLILAGI